MHVSYDTSLVLHGCLKTSYFLRSGSAQRVCPPVTLHDMNFVQAGVNKTRATSSKSKISPDRYSFATPGLHICAIFKEVLESISRTENSNSLIASWGYDCVAQTACIYFIQLYLASKQQNKKFFSQSQTAILLNSDILQKRCFCFRMKRTKKKPIYNSRAHLPSFWLWFFSRGSNYWPKQYKPTYLMYKTECVWTSTNNYFCIKALPAVSVLGEKKKSQEVFLLTDSLQHCNTLKKSDCRLAHCCYHGSEALVLISK